MPTHATVFLNRRNSNQLESDGPRLAAPFTSNNAIPMTQHSGSDNSNHQQQQHHQKQQYHIVTPGSPTKPQVGVTDERQLQAYNLQPPSSGVPCVDNNSNNNSNPYYGNTASQEASSRRPSPHTGYGRYPPPPPNGSSGSNGRSAYGDTIHEESRYHGHPLPQRHHLLRAPFFPQMHESQPHQHPQHTQQQQHHQQQHHSNRDKSSSIPYSSHRSRSFDEYGHESTPQHPDRHSQHPNHPNHSHNPHSRIQTSYPYPPANHHGPPHPHNECNEPPPPPPLSAPPQPPSGPPSQQPLRQQQQASHPQLQPRFRLSPQRRSDAPRPTGPPMLANTFVPQPRKPPTVGDISCGSGGRSRHHAYDQQKGQPPPPHPQMLHRRGSVQHLHHPPQPHVQQQPPHMSTPKHAAAVERPPQSQPRHLSQLSPQPQPLSQPPQPQTQPQTQHQTQPQPQLQQEQTPPSQQLTQQTSKEWITGQDTVTTMPIQSTDTNTNTNTNYPHNETTTCVANNPAEGTGCPPETIRRSSSRDTPSSPSNVSIVSQYSGPTSSWQKNSVGNEAVEIRKDNVKTSDIKNPSSKHDSKDKNDEKVDNAKAHDDTEANAPAEEEKEMINDAMLLAEMAAMARREIKTVPAANSVSPLKSEKSVEPVSKPPPISTTILQDMKDTAAAPLAQKISPVNDQGAGSEISKSPPSSSTDGTMATATNVSSPVLSPSPKVHLECAPITPGSPSKIIAATNLISSSNMPSLVGQGTEGAITPHGVENCADVTVQGPEPHPHPQVPTSSHYNNQKDERDSKNENNSNKSNVDGHEDCSHKATIVNSQSPSSRDANILLPDKCLDINDNTNNKNVSRPTPPPPPPPLTLNTRQMPPSGPGQHCGVPSHPMMHGFKSEAGGCSNSVHSSSSRGGFPPPSHSRTVSGPPSNHRFEGGISSGYLDRLQHHQQQQVHDGDDRWTENRVERQGPPTRPHSSNCSIPNSDPMMPDERMDYDYGNAQQYHHHQRRVHPGVATSEVGRVSLTPPPSHTVEGFDESYHHPMKRQRHQHQQRHPHYTGSGGHNEGEHEYYGNSGENDYGRPTKKAHVQFTNRPRERLHSGNDLNTINSRDEYDDDTYYPPAPYPPKQPHRSTEDDRPHHAQQQQQQRQQRPPSNNSLGHQSNGPPQQHRYYHQQESYSPRSVGSGPSRQQIHRGSYSSGGPPPPPLGRTNSQEYYHSPGASGTMPSHRSSGHPSRHRTVGHGGPPQVRDHLPPSMDCGSSGNSIKRQFETPVTPGTGGKVLDGTGGPQIIGEGTLGMTSSASSVTNGPPYDEYRHSPSNWSSFSNGFHPNPNPSCTSHRSSVVKKTILRRKCAWKNYPELEAFLIANREEYLRHSAMNYTVQQKQYNNRLTERLLEVAANHNYIFDENDFNFVAVRDRIRCYYKSYVQSSKKRGIIVGYSAQQQSQQHAKKHKLSPENPTSSVDTTTDDKEDNVDGNVGVVVGGDTIRMEDVRKDSSSSNSNNNSSSSSSNSNICSNGESHPIEPQNVNSIPVVMNSSSDVAGHPPSAPPTNSIAV